MKNMNDHFEEYEFEDSDDGIDIKYALISIIVAGGALLGLLGGLCYLIQLIF